MADTPIGGKTSTTSAGLTSEEENSLIPGVPSNSTSKTSTTTTGIGGKTSTTDAG